MEYSSGKGFPETSETPLKPPMIYIHCRLHRLQCTHTHTHTHIHTHRHNAQTVQSFIHNQEQMSHPRVKRINIDTLQLNYCTRHTSAWLLAQDKKMIVLFHTVQRWSTTTTALPFICTTTHNE